MSEVSGGDSAEIAVTVRSVARCLISTVGVFVSATVDVTPSVMTMPAPILPVVSKVLPSTFLK
jgi:hypothetical protein